MHVKGTAGLLRRIGMKRQRTHVLKSGQPHRRQRRLAPPGDHHVGVTILDGSQRFPDRIGGTGARGGNRKVRPFDPMHAGTMAAGGIHHQFRNGERGDLVDPLVEQTLVLRLKLGKPADAGTDHHAAAIRILFREIEPGVSDRVGGCRHGELREPIEPP